MVEVQTLMQIPDKGGFTLTAKMVTDATQGQIHLCQTICGGILLLAVHIDAADISLLGPNQIGTLDEHAAGAAAGVVQRSVKGLDHGGNQLDSIMGRVEFAFLLGCVDSKFL